VRHINERLRVVSAVVVGALVRDAQQCQSPC